MKYGLAILSVLAILVLTEVQGQDIYESDLSDDFGDERQLRWGQGGPGQGGQGQGGPGQGQGGPQARRRRRRRRKRRERLQKRLRRQRLQSACYDECHPDGAWTPCNEQCTPGDRPCIEQCQEDRDEWQQQVQDCMSECLNEQ